MFIYMIVEFVLDVNGENKKSNLHLIKMLVAILYKIYELVLLIVLIIFIKHFSF